MGSFIILFFTWFPVSIIHLLLICSIIFFVFNEVFPNQIISKTITRFATLFVFIACVFLEGAFFVNEKYVEMEKEYKQKIELAEKQSKEVNTKIEYVYKDRVKIITEKQIEYRDRIINNAEKIDQMCVLTPEMIDVMNDAAMGVGEPKK